MLFPPFADCIGFCPLAGRIRKDTTFSPRLLRFRLLTGRMLLSWVIPLRPMSFRPLTGMVRAEAQNHFFRKIMRITPNATRHIKSVYIGNSPFPGLCGTMCTVENCKVDVLSSPCGDGTDKTGKYELTESLSPPLRGWYKYSTLESYKKKERFRPLMRMIP